MSSVSVVSYQFAAEVIYPIGEVQGVSLMNTVNKLLSFALVQLTEGLTDDKPNTIRYLYGFILWTALPLIGLIPAWAVREDLRRLNMKEVERSVYIEENYLLNATFEQRQTVMKNHRVMASGFVKQRLQLLKPVEEVDLFVGRKSVGVESMSVKMVDHEKRRAGSTEVADSYKEKGSPLLG